MPEKEPKFTSQEAERGPQEAEDKIEEKDLKGIICTIRDRVFEKKVIKSMFELTAQNPETRVPVFDLDGNQIWPTRKKREDIEGTIKQKQKAAMEELD